MRMTSSSPNMIPSKVLPILVFFAAVLQHCFAALVETPGMPDVVPGILVRSDTTFGRVYTAKSCDGTLIAVCSSCNQLKLCIDPNMDSNNPLVDCPTALPYCSMSATTTEGICQKSPDTSITECATAAPKFKCTGVGYYADAYSCQTYYFCSAQAATPEVYNCPEGYKFNPKVNACSASTTACPTFACNSSLTDAVYQSLVANTQYYVFCQYDRTGATPKLTDTLVFSCGDGATFNPTTGKCVFKCPKEGVYANSAYPKQYYQCYISGGKLVYKDMLCAADQSFDLVTKRCILST